MVLAAETALVVANTGQAVALTREKIQQTAAKDTPKSPDTAADIPSAKVAARLGGKRVEALSERTETSTTWVNKDGSLTTELAAGPVRFTDEETGEWREVDLDLVQGADGTVEPKAHPGGLRLSGRSGTPAKSLTAAQQAEATDLVTLGEGDEQITLQWKGGLPKPKLDGTRAEYVDALPGADVVVEATRTGFEQYVELKERPGTGDAGDYSYTLPLKAEGLKAKQLADGSVLFTDKKNKKRAVMPAPVMWDATVDERSGEHTRKAAVGLKVVQKGALVDLVITPNAEFLADPDTTYPVTIDPSTSSLSNVFDTYVQQGVTVDQSTDTELDWGNPGTKNADGTPRTAQTFISWNTTPIQDALVLDAKLSLWNFHSGNNVDCKAYPWEVWSSPAASTSSRWSNRPTMTARKATSTETRGNSDCTTQPKGWINANVTTLVQEWASAKTTRGHMGIRATDESVVAQWKRVNSANAATNPPKLVVNYNYRPRTGTKQEAGPPYFSYGGDYMVNTTTPTLRDTFVDPDGDKVNGTFQIYDNATNTQVGNVLVSKYVASGQPASVTVPAGLLADGKTYKFRTSPYDGTHYNTGWSAWKTFTVDTKAPSAPTKIVSTDYPSDKWVKGTGKAGTFTVTPPAADHNWLEWSLDGVTWTKVATGGAAGDKALSVTPPKDGTHTLQVRAVDKADNKSEPIEYTFHAGPGGFVQPSEGERTARRLPLAVEVEAAKYNAVSFSWRRSEADPWVKIPVGDVTSGGNRLTAWPVPLTNGKNAPLVWNATDTVDPDGTIQIKADFTGPGSAAGSTEPLTAVVDRNASGAASREVGPGTVNLLTGDFLLSEGDASYFGLSVGRTASSREPNAQTDGQVPIFGKEWSSSAVADNAGSDYVQIEKVSATALSVVEEGGKAIAFTANAAQNGWIPEPGSEDLTLKGTFATSFTLTDSDGVETLFTKPDASATTWVVDTSKLNGLASSTSNVVSETVVVGGKVLARPKRIIAPTSAVSNATCAATPATVGCRSLEFVYATSTTATAASDGDYSGQVKEIRLWATEAGANVATSRAVQSYLYDTAGRLRQVWNPQITPSLKTTYTYDAAGRVTQLTQPGQLPWTLTYGKAGNAATAGDGMLLKASRPGLKRGTADVAEDTNATTLVYDVPLTGSAAPYKMGASDVRAWGQTDAPTDATAVFPGDVTPPLNSGSGLAAADYKRADVYYLGVSGHEVNTAQPGGHISTEEFDRFGNTVRSLTAGNRALALGTAPGAAETLLDLGINALTTSERAMELSKLTYYSADGLRETESFGPLHRVELTQDLKNGSTVLVPGGDSVPGREWAVSEYDTGRPTDGSAVVKDQLTLTVSGVRVRGYDSNMGEKYVNETLFDWAKGLPKMSITDSGGLNLVTSTAYDAQGRVTDVSQPGSTGSDPATRVSVYWSGSGTGWCKGRPEWADAVCWTGPAGEITGGGSEPKQVVDNSYEYGFFGQNTKRIETANGASRTTTVTFDNAGRQLKTTVTGPGQAVPDSTRVYDSATGLPAGTTSSTGGTTTKAYDKLGRLISYTDADGGVTRTEYDLLDRPVKVSDSVPSSVTYTYDTTAEPRGLPVSTTDSVAGTFSAGYDADGTVISQRLPGGYTLAQEVDTAGAITSRVYTRNSDGATVMSDSVSKSAHDQVVRHSGWSSQTFGYDKAGRLTSVDDIASDVCTRRTYTLDKRSNRTSVTSATAVSGADCPTTGGTARTSAYDSGDRMVDSGYVYDAFGRTTALPGSTVGYYANDRAYQLTSGTQRQTWQLDSAMRFRSWKTESGSGSTWTQTGSKLNHYDGDGDSPRWIVEDTGTGALTRNVTSLGGDFLATTSKTGEAVLQLANVHGDVALQLPLDSEQPPVVLDSDEFGNARVGQEPARYSWLGAKLRSAETVAGLTLMGSRLYNPVTGRFLSPDPVYGGNANPYVYPADPVNAYDLDGNKKQKKPRSCNFWCSLFIDGLGIVVAAVCTPALGPVVCGGIGGGLAGFAKYWWTHRGGHGYTHKGAAWATLQGAAIGGFGGAVGKGILKIGGKVFRGYGDRASIKAWDKFQKAMKK
ncbi:RHS repeat-associated core domain-containing protein [Streptomyces sp. NPDC014889]|uniref:RHS repeat-associated core domain-containing protein n=1 Tax=Streptomyces sp. NPDC014889 TaxID=3364928 RepID=UPI0036FE7A8C